jgi:hypothetical protein
MRHSSFRRRYHPGRRGTSRLLRCEPLEHRWLLSITVDTLVDEADGSIDDGDVSLRDAVAIAPAGETIDFDASLDGGTILLTMGELSITKAMTIDATALLQGLTIDAAGNDPTPGEDNGDGSRIFNIDDGDPGTDSPITMSGLTLTGGDAYKDGGAVDSRETLTITSSTILGNSAIGPGGPPPTDVSRGGGIRAYGDVTVTGSTISGNLATDQGGYGVGGGIFAYGDVTVTGSTISGNFASIYGGGIHGGSVTVASSTISGNSTLAFGGGISTGYYGGNVTVTSSTISGNSARNGGGILTKRGNVKVTSSTISGNSAWTNGGIYAYGDGEVTVADSIVAGNSADYRAPDLRRGNVRHSLIGDNTGSFLGEVPVGSPDARGNLIGGPINGIINPRLGPLADNGGPTQTHALLTGSPAIDAGDPRSSPPPEFDQRGNPRVADGDADGVPRIDMGAFEVLRGDVNGDGEVNGLDVDAFVDVLLNGPPSATADMNADGSVNGLDVDSFVATVVGGGNAVGVAAVGLLQEDFATEIRWPGSSPDATSTSPTTERSSARLLRTRHVHDGDDHSQLIHRRAVERVTGRRLRLGRDGHRSDHGDMAHQMARDWRATVERAFGDGADWTG